MMSTIRGHFDGKVIVLDHPSDLVANEVVEITPVRTREALPEKKPTIRDLIDALKAVKNRPTEPAEELIRKIDEVCGQIDPWPDFGPDHDR